MNPLLLHSPFPSLFLGRDIVVERLPVKDLEARLSQSVARALKKSILARVILSTPDLATRADYTVPGQVAPTEGI